jgi:hypothetical protein
MQKSSERSNRIVFIPRRQEPTPEVSKTTREPRAQLRDRRPVNQPPHRRGAAPGMATPSMTFQRC